MANAALEMVESDPASPGMYSPREFRVGQDIRELLRIRAEAAQELSEV